MITPKELAAFLNFQDSIVNVAEIVRIKKYETSDNTIEIYLLTKSGEVILEIWINDAKGKRAAHLRWLRLKRILRAR